MGRGRGVFHEVPLKLPPTVPLTYLALKFTAVRFKNTTKIQTVKDWTYIRLRGGCLQQIVTSCTKDSRKRKQRSRHHKLVAFFLISFCLLSHKTAVRLPFKPFPRSLVTRGNCTFLLSFGSWWAH